MTKTIIIYFSLSGTTKKAAEAIQKTTHADLVVLTPTVAYPQSYDAAVARGQTELEHHQLPDLQVTWPNLNQYDTILLGFPTWWQQPPLIIEAFLQQAKLTNQKIIPFTTSASTPMTDSMAVLRQWVQPTLLGTGWRYQANSSAMTAWLAQNKV